MIRIKKDAIAAITNSNSSEMCSQWYYGKTCPCYRKLSHSLGIIIRKTTYIELTKNTNMFISNWWSMIHSSILKLNTWFCNLQHYQQKPRSNDQDKDRLQVPFQATWLNMPIVTAILQFLQVWLHHSYRLGYCKDYCSIAVQQYDQQLHEMVKFVEKMIQPLNRTSSNHCLNFASVQGRGLLDGPWYCWRNVKLGNPDFRINWEECC